MKKVLQKVWRVIRLIQGIICGVFTVAFVFLGISDRQQWVVYLVLALVFGLLTFLLLRRKKPKAAQISSSDIAVIDQPEPVDAYIQVGNVVYRTDGQPISDREVPYLVETGLQEAIQREQNSPFHRSSADQELIFRFSEKHRRQSNALTSQFESLDDAAYKSKDLQEKIKLLSEALEKYKAAKAWHYKISKGGMMYFQDMWERICWEDHEEDFLEGLLWERDEVRPTILAAAESGFLQKEIYSQFEPEEKSSVQRILRSMEAEGLISRTKKSGTYWVALA